MKHKTPAQWDAMYVTSLQLEAAAHERTAYDLRHIGQQPIRRYTPVHAEDQS